MRSFIFLPNAKTVDETGVRLDAIERRHTDPKLRICFESSDLDNGRQLA
jgi:hypothetical protein